MERQPPWPRVSTWGSPAVTPVIANGQVTRYRLTQRLTKRPAGSDACRSFDVAGAVSVHNPTGEGGCRCGPSGCDRCYGADAETTYRCLRRPAPPAVESRVSVGAGCFGPVRRGSQCWPPRRVAL